MRASDPLSVASLSTWVIALVMVALAAFKPPVLGFVLLELWALLLISDLHTALPEDFYESESDATLHVAVSFVLSVVSLTSATIGALFVWAGLDVRWVAPPALTLAVAVGGLIVRAWVIRHVLSALDTLEDGEPRRVGYGIVILSILFYPLYVLWSHHRARRVLGEQTD